MTKLIRRIWRQRLSAIVTVATVCLVGLASQTIARNVTTFESQSVAVEYSVEELKLGREFMRGAWKRMAYSKDIESRMYVEQLGKRILGGAELDPERFRFFVVENPQLNAFAAPGGYITMHTGLISSTDNESELASVMGHEIAHITQRHLPRMIERARQRSLPAAAAMVAAILIGGQIGSAALVSTNAALAADQLKYNRDYEKEADAIGLRFMANSGFDTNAMPAFFNKLHRHTNLTSIQVPEYLRSHPLSINRIAETESRAAGYAVVTPDSGSDYLHIRARVTAMGKFGQGQRGEYAPLPNYDSIENRAVEYGNAVGAIKAAEYADARARVDQLLKVAPDNIFYRLLNGQLLLAVGNTPEAVRVLTGVLESHPDRIEPMAYLTRALIAAEEFDAAKKILRKWLRVRPQSELAYAQLSRVEGELGNTTEAFQARAEYFSLRFDNQRAIQELNEARKHADGNYYLVSSIDARTEELRHEMQRFGEKIRTNQ